MLNKHTVKLVLSHPICMKNECFIEDSVQLVTDVFRKYTTTENFPFKIRPCHQFNCISTAPTYQKRITEGPHITSLVI